MSCGAGACKFVLRTTSRDGTYAICQRCHYAPGERTLLADAVALAAEVAKLQEQVAQLTAEREKCTMCPACGEDMPLAKNNVIERETVAAIVAWLSWGREHEVALAIERGEWRK